MSREEAVFVGRAAAMRRVRMEVAGLQAALTGGLIQDRETLLPRLSRERRLSKTDERVLFNLQGRFEDALTQLEPDAPFQQRSASGSMARLKASIEASRR